MRRITENVSIKTLFLKKEETEGIALSVSTTMFYSTAPNPKKYPIYLFKMTFSKNNSKTDKYIFQTLKR